MTGRHVNLLSGASAMMAPGHAASGARGALGSRAGGAGRGNPPGCPETSAPSRARSSGAPCSHSVSLGGDAASAPAVGASKPAGGGERSSSREERGRDGPPPTESEDLGPGDRQKRKAPPIAEPLGLKRRSPGQADFPEEDANGDDACPWPTFEAWHPRPLLRVQGIPAGCSEAEVCASLMASGLAVESVCSAPLSTDVPGGGEECLLAFARLPPPPCPRSVAFALARAAETRCRVHPPRLRGRELQVSQCGADAVVFVGSLAPHSEQDAETGLRALVAGREGRLLRAWAPRSALGRRLGYGFLEFGCPSDADRFRARWQGRAREQRREAGERRGTGEGGSLSSSLVPRVELAPLRCGTANFGTTLHVEGFAPGRAPSPGLLRRACARHGRVERAFVAASGAYALVTFADCADAAAAVEAMRGAEDLPGLGRLRASFSNPTRGRKHKEDGADGGRREGANALRAPLAPPLLCYPPACVWPGGFAGAAPWVGGLPPYAPVGCAPFLPGACVSWACLPFWDAQGCAPTQRNVAPAKQPEA